MPEQYETFVDPVVKLDAALLARNQTPDAQKTKPPVTIDHESQLFADDHLIAHKASVFRRLNRPHKQRDVLLRADRAWEGNACVYGCVVTEDEGFRLYYKGSTQHALPSSEFVKQFGYGKYPVCLAHSKDAIDFVKRKEPYAAVAGTNIIIDDMIDDFTILKDHAEADPQRRYKMLCSRGNWWAGLTPATSADGLRWTWGQENEVTYLGDRMSYWYDPVQCKHVAWSRCYPLVDSRVVVHKETADFANWNHPRDSHPRVVLQMDRFDHAQTQFYGAYPFWYRSMYFCYLEVYYIHLQRLDTQLCCSRDGRSWTRLCDREVFLPNGEHGEFDGYWIVPTFNAPILRDGRLLIHYNGRAEPHAQPGFEAIKPGFSGAFALATLREDGFVSLDSVGTEGVVQTHPLALPPQRDVLSINACPFDARPQCAPMKLSVEILDESGEVLCAYGIRPTADPTQVWTRIAIDRALPDVVHLRFRMHNARLYSFRFEAR